MEIDIDFRKELDNMAIEKEYLYKQLELINNREVKIHDFINKCSIFDEGILLVICQLLSTMENEPFSPFVYKKYTEVGCYPRTDAEDICVGIASNANIMKYINNGRNNLDRFFQQKLGYKIFIKSGKLVSSNMNNIDKIVDYGNYCDAKSENKKIGFKFLLRNYGTRNSYHVVFSHYDFADYGYVQEFITYLFKLQVKNNGKQLSFDEMKNALSDFLELEKNKTRQKKK